MNINIPKIKLPIENKKVQTIEKKNFTLKEILNDVKGVLLDENFILSHFVKKNIDDDDSFTSDDDDVDKIKEYIHNNNTESESESIFID